MIWHDGSSFEPESFSLRDEFDDEEYEDVDELEDDGDEDFDDEDLDDLDEDEDLDEDDYDDDYDDLYEDDEDYSAPRRRRNEWE
jgi:ribonuclease E